jgi:hypothetical protein
MSDHGADPTETDGLRAVLTSWRTTVPPPGHVAPSATTMMEKPAAALHAIADPRGDRVVAERDLGDQDHVPSARDSRLEGDPAGIATHDLEHHQPVMRCRRRVEAIDGLRGDRPRGVEAEGDVRPGDVVVDGLRHAHHGDAPGAGGGRRSGGCHRPR